MRTKNLFYIAVAAISLVTFSCSDDLLDKKPLDGYSELDVFADAALLNDFVNGTYRGLRHPFDDENSLTDGLTDNAYNQHGSADNTIKIYTKGIVTEDNGESVTRGLWSSAYLNIRRTNLFFEKVGDSPIDPAKLVPLEGEMHFLRAFFYFDLLRWYGGVPLITKTFTLDEDYDITRNSADEVADFIVAECDQAIAQLHTLDADEYESGKASVEAAMALKARTLLYIASPLFNPTNDLTKWTAARDANKAVMDLTTVSVGGVTPADYGAMFRGDNEEEVIFSRYFTQTINQGWGVNVWLFPNSAGGWANSTPTQNLVDSYELTNGEIPSEAASYDDQNPYVNRDPRFYQTILYNGAPFKDATYDYFVDQVTPANSGKDSPSAASAPWNSSKTGYNFRKWTQEDAAWDAGNLGPWILFRQAEFYLNYAEAEIALSNETEAKTAMNVLRARMNMPDVTESGAELIERYRRERRVELVLEDHRFFDIRRWQIGPDALDIPAMGVNVYKNGAVIQYVYNKVADNTRNWDDKLYLLPIPAQEVQRSHEALTQNPGYDF
jgi:hypothetical protein